MNRARGDIGLLVLLSVDGLVVGIMSVAFLNPYIGMVAAPAGILIAAVGNATLVWLASAYAGPPMNWLPVFGWGLVVVLGLGGGPGGDVLFLSDWRVAGLVLAGIGAPAAVAWFTGTRRRIDAAARRGIGPADGGR
ncbi:hypothetical protein GCM10010528_26760 [Gordonia defluvii]|jgi:4-amino-4-deoxy-L-arabinose transferase-like glycosyltransferase|uniref:Facilitated glucose transporter n=1 Tax=Gordonia defluvii TaxID=283718 RepID=A0ABP6LNW9_9ACTN|nr:facilitated glucose transporter [Gordonia sp. UBA5067]